MQTTTKKEYDVAVIGGGPAGLMAAAEAAQSGAEVILLEKNDAPGKKLSITGGGRCNITNAEYDTRELLKHFGDAEKFLYSPFAQFGVKETFSFFEKHKLPIVVEARKRAFPKSQSASDVLNTLIKHAQRSGVQITTGVSAKRFIKKDTKVVAVETSQGKIFAKRFIIATGGLSAPSTGSTGDGIRMLGELGHTIHKPNPNLVPLKTNEKWVHRISGVSLSFMTIRFKQNGKTHIKKTGKILFTHFGVSGPLIINTSGEVRKLLERGPVLAAIDLFPDTEFNDLDKRLIKLFEKNKNKQIKNVLSEILPHKLSDVILFILDPHFGNTPVHSVFKEERNKIVHIMKELVFPITGTMGLDRAIVADGGVDLKEVNFKTMQSKLYENLHLVGDVLNITRPSGGYSLQLCWTTGYVAGKSTGELSQGGE